MEDVKRVGARYLLAAGDISAEALPVDLGRAGQLLTRFGDYRRDYFVARGNHDRAHTGDPYASCRAGQWQGNDCFHDAYFPGIEPTYFSTDLSGLHVIGLDAYDKAGNGGDPGGMSEQQMAWFRRDLAAHRDQPTLVFGHHPLVMQDSAFPITASNTLDQKQAAAVLDRYAKSPGVFLHHAGHTHRNHRAVRPRPASCTRRSPRRRSTRAASHCCGCTRRATRSTSTSRAASWHAGGASVAARRSRDTGPNSRSATTFPTATSSSSAT